MQTKYYQKVNKYYNEDALHFEKRYGENQLLKKIRESFRYESEEFVGKNILEIGYGPGFDLVYFADKYPESNIYGLDISDEMRNLAKNNVDKLGLKNVYLNVGSVEDISDCFPNIKFDLIYVYFGALNTVDNIEEVPEILKKVLSPNGVFVLTFINKYYLSLVIKNLFHFRFKQAFARIKRIWGGYSPYRHLDSRCYSFQEIKRIFKRFKILKRKGYSITFPAWYEHKKFRKKDNILQKLWQFDLFLNKTPFWQFGEYALYVIKP